MSKVGQSITGLKGFVNEVKVELSKCTWPTRPELMGSTLVVIVSVLLLSAFVGLSDYVLLNLLKLIVG
jgi:preprotein translocase subunit SecE